MVCMQHLQLILTKCSTPIFDHGMFFLTYLWWVLELQLIQKFGNNKKYIHVVHCAKHRKFWSLNNALNGVWTYTPAIHSEYTDNRLVWFALSTTAEFSISSLREIICSPMMMAISCIFLVNKTISLCLSDTQRNRTTNDMTDEWWSQIGMWSVILKISHVYSTTILSSKGII